eukprot:GGOE01022384.1.p1 GENE.GGOE01022384.1~~GGOE01022384.1.p1  ORF type:complete len:334 (-),score=124.12 GGOE01022384.1:281-1282(-)
MVNVGINGFGRIGRLVFRACLEREDVRVTAINDAFAEPDYMAYMLKYDSVHGRLKTKVSVAEGRLLIDGRPITIFQEADPATVRWSTANVDCVVEATGVYTTVERASAHLKGGAQRVVITAPSADAPMIIMGVNSNAYRNGVSVVSSASCTTACLAPIVQVLQDQFGIVEGLFTTVHATTATQKTVDAPSPKEWRGGRGILNNIIPGPTGAAKALGRIFPELQGKLLGMALRVPVADVSVVDLTVRLEKPAAKAALDHAMREAAEGPMAGVLAYSEDPLVSSDLVGSRESAVYDAHASLSLTPHFLKVIAWYDNEYGYACRVVDLVCLVTGVL